MRHELQDDLADCLDRELSRLPEKYRIPIVLCDLEGRTHKEAASRLGWPIGTVSSRLSRARTMLARRLSRRGVSLSAGSLAALLAQDSASASMPTQLIGSTAQAASLFAAGGAVTAGVVSAEVAALRGEVLKVMLLGKLKVATAMLLAASVLVAGGTGLSYRALATEASTQEARPTEPAIQEARPVDATNQPPSPTEQPIQEAKPVDATNQQPGTTEQPIQEARPIEPARPKEDTRAKSNDQRPGDTAPRIPNQPLPSAVPPSDAEPAVPQDQRPTSPVDPPEPQDPISAKNQDQLAEDPLADQIMTGAHTPKQLERAKALIESMLTLEKEAQSKSPEELTKMINDRTNELDEARWQIRVMTAQLRRLTKIKKSAQVGTRRGASSTPVSAAPSGRRRPAPVGAAPTAEDSEPVLRGRTDSTPKS